MEGLSGYKAEEISIASLLSTFTLNFKTYIAVFINISVIMG
jgi:hypothetical protein